MGWAQDRLKEIKKQANTTQSDTRAELEKVFTPERIKRIQRKELRAYARSLDKKWKNWLNSVSQ